MRMHTLTAAILAASGLLAATASASYHTFRINEVYSNPSGTVQFIEMREILGFGGQQFVTSAPDIKSNGNDFVFPSNLTSGLTANKNFLLGTSAYAAIAGAPAPDYTIPANFFNPAGDTLQYGTTGPDGTVDLTTFGALPGSATQSLNRVGTSGNSYTTATNSPTNFAGATGSVPEPGTGLLLVVAGAMGLRRRRA
jgi:hypothetical protein